MKNNSVTLVGISSEVLGWLPYPSTGHVQERNERMRPYEHLRHAEQVIARNGTEFDRVDAITTLKRAVDIRLKCLNNTYEFKRVPLKQRLGVLEICQRFGIFRPIMISKLNEIRNRVEHQDSPPPSNGECEQFAEFVWYFLKTTDSLVDTVPDSFSIDPHGGLYEEHHWLTVRTGPIHKWDINIHGWLPECWTSVKPPPDWILLECSEFVKACEFPEKNPPTAFSYSMHQEGDMWIAGKVKDPKNHGKSFFELYFAAT